MSKAALKKELANLDKEELINLILESYTARKEIKEYYEFYLDPDIAKLTEKFLNNIIKELKRSKRGGYSKARISFIRSQLKEFAAFQPGFQAELDLLFKVINYGMLFEISFYYSDTLEKGIATLVEQSVELADRNQVLDTTIQRFRSLFDNERTGTRYFRNYLDTHLRNYLANRPALLADPSSPTPPARPNPPCSDPVPSRSIPGLLRKDEGVTKSTEDVTKLAKDVTKHIQTTTII